MLLGVFFVLGLLAVGLGLHISRPSSANHSIRVVQIFVAVVVIGLGVYLMFAALYLALNPF